MQLEILAPKLAQDLFCLLNYPPNLLRNCGLGVSSSGRSQDDQQDAGEVEAGTLKGEPQLYLNRQGARSILPVLTPPSCGAVVSQEFNK